VGETGKGAATKKIERICGNSHQKDSHTKKEKKTPKGKPNKTAGKKEVKQEMDQKPGQQEEGKT